MTQLRYAPAREEDIPAIFAQAGAKLGVFLKTKSKQLRGVAGRGAVLEVGAA